MRDNPIGIGDDHPVMNAVQDELKHLQFLLQDIHLVCRRIRGSCQAAAI